MTEWDNAHWADARRSANEMHDRLMLERTLADERDRNGALRTALRHCDQRVTVLPSEPVVSSTASTTSLWWWFVMDAAATVLLASGGEFLLRPGFAFVLFGLVSTVLACGLWASTSRERFGLES